MQLILLPLTGALVQTKCGNIVWPSQRTTTGSNVSTWVKIAARSKITEVRHFKVLVQSISLLEKAEREVKCLKCCNISDLTLLCACCTWRTRWLQLMGDHRTFRRMVHRYYIQLIQTIQLSHTTISYLKFNKRGSGKSFLIGTQGRKLNYYKKKFQLDNLHDCHNFLSHSIEPV